MNYPDNLLSVLFCNAQGGFSEPAVFGLANQNGVLPVRPADQMSRPGGTPGQRPTRPQGGRFSPTLGPGAALVSLLR